MTRASGRRLTLTLDPALLVLRRPDGTVQLGWGPDTGRVVVPPDGLDAFDVCTLLRLLDGRRTRERVLEAVADRGLDRDAVAALLDELLAAGVILGCGPGTPAPSTEVHVRVYGQGPVTEALCEHLTVAAGRWSRAVRYTDPAELRRGVDCVVLADAQVPDPRIVRDLMELRIPHLAVRLRDGRGVLGPFVVPGRTSCLRCADLTRTDLDSAWPRLAAQLWSRVGQGDRATAQVTAALAVRQLDPVLTDPTAIPPAMVDATVEVDLPGLRFETRRWPRHPDCACATAREGGQA